MLVAWVIIFQADSLRPPVAHIYVPSLSLTHSLRASCCFYHVLTLLPDCLLALLLLAANEPTNQTNTTILKACCSHAKKLFLCLTSVIYNRPISLVQRKKREKRWEREKIGRRDGKVKERLCVKTKLDSTVSCNHLDWIYV